MQAQLYAAQEDGYTTDMVEAARIVMGIYKPKPTPPREQKGGYRDAWRA